MLFFSVIVEFPAGGAAGPKMVEQRPKENEGVVVNSPDYDTLKIVREMDVFGTGDKDKQREGMVYLFLLIRKIHFSFKITSRLKHRNQKMRRMTIVMAPRMRAYNQEWRVSFKGSIYYV